MQYTHTSIKLIKNANVLHSMNNFCNIMFKHIINTGAEAEWNKEQTDLRLSISQDCIISR